MKWKYALSILLLCSLSLYSLDLLGEIEIELLSIEIELTNLQKSMIGKQKDMKSLQISIDSISRQLSESLNSSLILEESLKQSETLLEESQQDLVKMAERSEILLSELETLETRSTVTRRIAIASTILAIIEAVAIYKLVVD